MSNKGKKMGRILFSPAMVWSIPFVRAMRPLLPLERIQSITAYKTPITKQEDSEGLIDNASNKYKVRVRATKHCYTIINNTPLTLQFIERKPQMFWYMLSALAHELAHLTYWEHDPEHFRLECRLMLRCYKVLKQLGVKDLYKIGPP